MKKQKKIILLCPIIVIILAFITIIMYIVISNRQNREDKNINEKLYEETSLDNWQFKILDINYEDGFSNIVLEIKNNFKETKKIGSVSLKLYDNNDTLVSELFIYDDTDIEPNNVINLTSSIDKDITAASKVTYEIMKEEEDEE